MRGNNEIGANSNERSLDLPRASVSSIRLRVYLTRRDMLANYSCFVNGASREATGVKSPTSPAALHVMIDSGALARLAWV
jgi:hypothetical protein